MLLRAIEGLTGLVLITAYIAGFVALKKRPMLSQSTQGACKNLERAFMLILTCCLVTHAPYVIMGMVAAVTSKSTYALGSGRAFLVSLFVLKNTLIWFNGVCNGAIFILINSKVRAFVASMLRCKDIEALASSSGTASTPNRKV